MNWLEDSDKTITALLLACRNAIEGGAPERAAMLAEAASTLMTAAGSYVATMTAATNAAVNLDRPPGKSSKS